MRMLTWAEFAKVPAGTVFQLDGFDEAPDRAQVLVSVQLSPAPGCSDSYLATDLDHAAGRAYRIHVMKPRSARFLLWEQADRDELARRLTGTP